MIVTYGRSVYCTFSVISLVDNIIYLPFIILYIYFFLIFSRKRKILCTTHDDAEELEGLMEKEERIWRVTMMMCSKMTIGSLRMTTTQVMRRPRARQRRRLWWT